MALLAFHWSGVYKDKLLSGRISGTIMPGKHRFIIGDEILAYLSPKENLLEGKIDQRIGKLKIKEVRAMKVADLAEKEVKATGYSTMKELRMALKKWYGAGENDMVTFIGFDLVLE